MRLVSFVTKTLMVIVSCFVMSCSLSDQYMKKNTAVGFITTPPSYYTSAKARSLGVKYKENLDQLAERILRSAKTANLQFANNISSVGGIGFFTHSATQGPDERYLEVVVSSPETFDNNGAFDAKLAQVFEAYGSELLTILASDPAIYREDDVRGYGLNLTWRNLVRALPENRIVVEGAVIYLKKEMVGRFLHQDMDQRQLLTGAVIFAAEANSPLKLVSYRETAPRPDTRLPIHEESLGVSQIEAKRESRSLSPQAGTGNGRSATEKGEGQPTGVQISKVDEGRSVAAQNAVTRSAGRAVETAQAVMANSVQRDGPEKERSGGSTAEVGQKPSGDARTVRVSKDPSEIQVSSVEASQAETKDQSERVVSQEFGAKNSIADDQETAIKVARVAPTQEGQEEIAKPQRGAEAKDSKRDNSLEKVSERSAREDDHKGVAVANAEVKSLSLPPTEATNTVKEDVQASNPKLLKEQIALAKKHSDEIGSEGWAAAHSRPSMLEGYVIQIGFNSKTAAQKWRETLERRGYALSLTEAEGAGLIRLRLGNFSVREEAERQLRFLKQEGLSGIVINLPQAYRPEIRAETREGSQTPSVQTDN